MLIVACCMLHVACTEGTSLRQLWACECADDEEAVAAAEAVLESVNEESLRTQLIEQPDFLGLTALMRAAQLGRDALALWDTNCGAWGYLTELYIQQANASAAESALASLCDACGASDSAVATTLAYYETSTLTTPDVAACYPAPTASPIASPTASPILVMTDGVAPAAGRAARATAALASVLAAAALAF